jgi:hypothetical protein
MKPRIPIILVILLIGVLQANAGWIVKMTSTAPDGSKDTEVFYIENNKWKVDSRDTGSFIFDLDKGVMMIVDHQSRTVYSGDPSEITGMRNEAVKQMEEQMKNMPAEQREMIKKMMEQQMGQQPASGKGLDVEVRKTAEKSIVAGFAVLKYEIRVGGQHRENVWLTSKISLADEVDIAKLQKFMESMSAGGMGEADYEDSPEYFNLYRQGFPLKTETIMPGGNVVSEAYEVEEKKIAPKEFNGPSDYKRKPLTELMNRPM